MPDTETMNTRRWREEQKKRQPAKPQMVSATTPPDTLGPPSATPYADENEAQVTGGYRPATMAQAYKNVNLDREEVMRRLWQSKYGPRELRNPGAVGGLIEQRRDLERTSNTLRPAAVEPGPVMTPDQERLSRQRIADQMIQANAQMTQDVLARRGEAPRVGPPVTNADFERINMMRRMGVSEGQMGDLEKLTGRPSPRLVGPPSLNDVVYANPDTLARPRTEAEYSAEVANRNAAFEQANAPDGPAAQELARYNLARKASMESEALAREVATNRLKTQAVMTDPALAREQRLADIQGLRTGNQLRDIENRKRLGLASIDPRVNESVMDLTGLVQSIGDGGVGYWNSDRANATADRAEAAVRRIISLMAQASPESKAEVTTAITRFLNETNTVPSITTGAFQSQASARYYAALRRLLEASRSW